MAISFESALGIHDKALQVRTQRAEILANNLANSDTPNFKARDLDFRAVLKDQLSVGAPLAASTTNARHQTLSNEMGFNNELLYRTPMQPSIDGNTVDEHAEHAAYMENSLAFQASFTFLNGKFKGLMSAIRGE